MNMLASATALSNRELLARLPRLAADERTASAALVAHLVALDMRPDVYAGEGYGSLFAYCSRALRLSEDAACTRIAAVSACRRFPRILDLLVSGELSLTAVRRIGPHLTAENCDSVLARAVNRTRSQIDALVAELAPQPDVLPSVRKLPVRVPTAPAHAPLLSESVLGPAPASVATAPPPAAAPPIRRPAIQPSAPERYRVQFTIGPEAHEKLRRVQALLRREIPSGDPGLIFERAVELLLEKVEKQKLGKVRRRRMPAIRSETDNAPWSDVPGSRYIPNEVKRVVWDRDGGCCAFVSASGRRCGERSFLEFHHLIPYALGGQARAGNIALRCRRHNQYEARQVFAPSLISEPPAGYIPGPSTIATGAPRVNSRRAAALS